MTFRVTRLLTAAPLLMGRGNCFSARIPRKQPGMKRAYPITQGRHPGSTKSWVQSNAGLPLTPVHRWGLPSSSVQPPVMPRCGTPQV